MADQLDEKQIRALNESYDALIKQTIAEARAKKKSREQEQKDVRDAIRVKRQEIIQDKKNEATRKQRLRLLEKQNDLYGDKIEAEETQLKLLHKTIDAFHGLGKAAFAGEGSISAFTDHVRGLGFIGNRLDTNLETFRQLSQTGASFGQSLVVMRESAHSAALPLDDFAKLVNENAQSMTAMFGSTTEGAKRIAELGRITREVGIKRLAPLGFTVDEINDTLLLNLDSQRRTGILSRMTDTQRTQSAIRFAEQLDRLAKLTGQQRDELRSQIEQQQSNERFQIALQNQTDATRQRLQGFAATVGNIAPGLNEGFQDLIANAGVPVTESALALVQNIPEAQEIIRRLISGTITSEQALGEIRAASIKSMDRFGKATVTGQVEFTRFQGDVINLGRRIVDVDGVFKDQNATATSLVKNLTSFEQATKVLSAQFQGIETGMLEAFGPALGNLIFGIQKVMGGGGIIAQALAKSPALSASLLITGLAGKFLFPKAMQIWMIAKGVEIGTRMAQTGRGFMNALFGGKGGKGTGARGTGGMGRYGRFAGSTAGKFIGPTSLLMSGGTAYSQLSDDDKSNDWAGYGNVAGMAIGGTIGTIFGGPWGGMLGAGLGGQIGSFGGAMAQNAFGGSMDGGGDMLGGKTYQLHKDELVTPQQDAHVTPGKDLQKIFDTKALEAKLSTLISEVQNVNKGVHSTNNSLNTVVAIESRALKAHEKTARKEMNIGNI